jgi:hypothetical protein
MEGERERERGLMGVEGGEGRGGGWVWCVKPINLTKPKV